MSEKPTTELTNAELDEKLWEFVRQQTPLRDEHYAAHVEEKRFRRLDRQSVRLLYAAWAAALAAFLSAVAAFLHR